MMLHVETKIVKRTAVQSKMGWEKIFTRHFLEE